MALLAAKFWSFYVQGSLFLSVFLYVRMRQKLIFRRLRMHARILSWLIYYVDDKIDCVTSYAL